MFVFVWSNAKTGGAINVYIYVNCTDILNTSFKKILCYLSYYLLIN